MLESEPKINTRFQKVLRRLSDAEDRELGLSIEREGCREPLKLWRGFLADGMNRFRHVSRLKLPYKTEDISDQFETEDEVEEWILRNQLGRRNLSPKDHEISIGRLYLLEKNRVGRPAADEATFTKEQLARLDEIASDPDTEDTTRFYETDNGQMAVQVVANDRAIMVYYGKKGNKISDARSGAFISETGISFKEYFPGRCKQSEDDKPVKLGHSDPIKKDAPDIPRLAEVDADRLSSGDVYQSDSAQSIAESRTIENPPFTYEGKLYVSVGGVPHADLFKMFGDKSFTSSVTAYELVPEADYEGDTHEHREGNKGEKYYSGLCVTWNDQPYVLKGPARIFLPILTPESAFRLFEVKLYQLQKLEKLTSSDEDWWRSRWYEFVDYKGNDTAEIHARKNAFERMFPKVWEAYKKQFCRGTSKIVKKTDEEQPKRTSQKIADEYGVSERKVRRAADLVEVLDKLPEEDQAKFFKGETSRKALLEMKREITYEDPGPVSSFAPGKNEKTLEMESKAARLELALASLKRKLQEILPAENKAKQPKPLADLQGIFEKAIGNLELEISELKFQFVCEACNESGCSECNETGYVGDGGRRYQLGKIGEDANWRGHNV